MCVEVNSFVSKNNLSVRMYILYLDYTETVDGSGFFLLTTITHMCKWKWLIYLSFSGVERVCVMNIYIMFFFFFFFIIFCIYTNNARRYRIRTNMRTWTAAAKININKRFNSARKITTQKDCKNTRLQRYFLLHNNNPTKQQNTKSQITLSSLQLRTNIQC